MNNRPTPGREHRKRAIVVVGSRSQDVLPLSMMLEHFKYDVSTANSAAQALERVSGSTPSLVITDTNLPGMSGFDLYELLRQDWRTASIPLVFMVFPGDAAAEQRCRGIGAAGCISKPVQAEELYRTVQEVIEPRPRANIRIDTRLPLTLNEVPLHCQDEGCRVTLSTRGMYIPMPKPLPRNNRVAMKFTIKGRTISAEGTVLHNQTSGVGSHKEPGMGLTFVSISSQDEEFIRAFIRDEITRDVRAALSQGQIAGF